MTEASPAVITLFFRQEPCGGVEGKFAAGWRAWEDGKPRPAERHYDERNGWIAAMLYHQRRQASREGGAA